MSVKKESDWELLCIMKLNLYWILHLLNGKRGRSLNLCTSLAQVEHLAGRHVIQVVSLPYIPVATFVQKKNASKSRNTATIYFPQVSCGAYHSLALVRSLPPKNYNTQNPPEKRERGQSPHYSVTEKEESFTVDGGHYCPLGVELTEVMTEEVKILHNAPVIWCHRIVD